MDYVRSPGRVRISVGIAVIWGAYGAFYFVRNSKKLGRDTLTAKANPA
jgi:hypothetical protein